ncbi:MAG: hypothetical protein AB1Z51_08370 [Desulfuromonadales bacterium]
MMSLANRLFAGIFLSCLLVACAPTKTIDVWKADGYQGHIEKVLVIAVAREEFIREQFENVLSNKLSDLGVYAVPGHKVLPQNSTKIDKQAVLAAVEKAGVDKVLVARSIKKEEIRNHQYGGMFFAPDAVYTDGWYTYYTGSIIYPEREYDTSYFTVATNLFELNNPKPVWSYLAQLRVESSKQGAVEDLVPMIVEQLNKSQLLN